MADATTANRRRRQEARQQQGRGGTGMTLTQAMRMINQGLLLGYGDETIAAAEAVAGYLTEPRRTRKSLGQYYDESLERERGAIRDTREDHLLMATVLESAGSMMLPGGALSRLGNAQRGILRHIMDGAAMGAVGGAIYGGGVSEGGARARIEGATDAAKLGAAFGGTMRGALARWKRQGIQQRVEDEYRRNVPTQEDMHARLREMERQPRPLRYYRDDQGNLIDPSMERPGATRMVDGREVPVELLQPVDMGERLVLRPGMDMEDFARDRARSVRSGVAGPELDFDTRLYETWYGKVRKDLQREGLDRKIYPNVHRVMRNLGKASTSNDLLDAYRSLNRVVVKGDRDEARLAEMLQVRMQDAILGGQRNASQVSDELAEALTVRYRDMITGARSPREVAGALKIRLHEAITAGKSGKEIWDSVPVLMEEAILGAEPWRMATRGAGMAAPESWVGRMTQEVKGSGAPLATAGALAGRIAKAIRGGQPDVPRALLRGDLKQKPVLKRWTVTDREDLSARLAAARQHEEVLRRFFDQRAARAVDEDDLAQAESFRRQAERARSTIRSVESQAESIGAFEGQTARDVARLFGRRSRLDQVQAARERGERSVERGFRFDWRKGVRGRLGELYRKQAATGMDDYTPAELEQIRRAAGATPLGRAADLFEGMAPTRVVSEGSMIPGAGYLTAIASDPTGIGPGALVFGEALGRMAGGINRMRTRGAADLAESMVARGHMPERIRVSLGPLAHELMGPGFMTAGRTMAETGRPEDERRRREARRVGDYLFGTAFAAP